MRDVLVAKPNYPAGDYLEEIDSILAEFPSWSSSRKSCGLGLLNIQLYYDLEPRDLVQGLLRDPRTQATFQAATRLTQRDVKLIADLAKEQKHLKSQIQWLRVFPELRKKYRRAVREHNDLLSNPGAVVK